MMVTSWSELTATMQKPLAPIGFATIPRRRTFSLPAFVKWTQFRWLHRRDTRRILIGTFTLERLELSQCLWISSTVLTWFESVEKRLRNNTHRQIYLTGDTTSQLPHRDETRVRGLDGPPDDMCWDHCPSGGSAAQSSLWRLGRRVRPVAGLRESRHVPCRLVRVGRTQIGSSSCIRCALAKTVFVGCFRTPLHQYRVWVCYLPAYLSLSLKTKNSFPYKSFDCR